MFTIRRENNFRFYIIIIILEFFSLVKSFMSMAFMCKQMSVSYIDSQNPLVKFHCLCVSLLIIIPSFTITCNVKEDVTCLENLRLYCVIIYCII